MYDTIVENKPVEYWCPHQKANIQIQDANDTNQPPFLACDNKPTGRQKGIKVERTITSYREEKIQGNLKTLEALIERGMKQITWTTAKSKPNQTPRIPITEYLYVLLEKLSRGINANEHNIGIGSFTINR